MIKCRLFLIHVLKTAGLFTVLYLLCEYYIYYIILSNCSWPKLDLNKADLSIKDDGEDPVKAMFLTDLHLVEIDMDKNTWFSENKYTRTQWHMHRSFKTAINLHRPEVVFVLGDLTEHGLWTNTIDFEYLVSTFFKYFSVPDDVKMYIVAGNHDVGFHQQVSYKSYIRFVQAFNAPSAQLVTIRNNHFLLLNSVALENDGCPICDPAEIAMKQIQLILQCTKNSSHCESNVENLGKYSQPILIQHIPLYRYSDKNCSGIDTAPLSLKISPFRQRVDCLTKKISNRLLKRFDPRIAFAGHIHHGCVTQLKNNGVEYTLPSFNRMLKNNPNYALALFTPNNHALNKCELPKAWISHLLYVVGILSYVFYLIYCYHKQIEIYGKYLIVNNNKDDC